MKRVADEHVTELETKILELTAMRDTLQESAEACHGDHRLECPILGDLESGGRRGAGRRRVDPHQRDSASAA